MDLKLKAEIKTFQLLMELFSKKIRNYRELTLPMLPIT